MKIINVQAIPIKFAVKIVRLKVYNYNFFSVRGPYYDSHGIQTWHDGRLMRGTSAHSRFDDHDLDASS